MSNLQRFIAESNLIEGMGNVILSDESTAYEEFLKLKHVTIGDLENFVNVIQPGAVLREKVGLDVRVGNHIPPAGGDGIVVELAHIMTSLEGGGSLPGPYQVHQRYEKLHPFTDGNGRSGRVLWLWMMGGIDKVPLGFLHTWYYQSLRNGG